MAASQAARCNGAAAEKVRMCIPLHLELVEDCVLWTAMAVYSEVCVAVVSLYDLVFGGLRRGGFAMMFGSDMEKKRRR